MFAGIFFVWRVRSRSFFVFAKIVYKLITRKCLDLPHQYVKKVDRASFDYVIFVLLSLSVPHFKLKSSKQMRNRQTVD